MESHSIVEHERTYGKEYLTRKRRNLELRSDEYREYNKMFFEWKERLDNMEKERLEIVSSPMYQMMSDIKSIIDEDPEIRKAFEENPTQKSVTPVEEADYEDSEVKERWENDNEDDWEYLVSGRKPREEEVDD